MQRGCLCTFLGAAMFAAAFSGCGSKGGSASTADTSVAADTQASGSDTAEPTSATETAASAADTASTAAAAENGKVDCPALKEAAGRMFVNWQVVIGLSRNPDVSSWSTTPIGTLPEFASQLKTLERGLAQTGPEAADAIAFMQGANDIVQKGVAGDAAAGTDLAAYLGTDVMKSIQKQTPIGLAMEKVGC